MANETQVSNCALCSKEIYSNPLISYKTLFRCVPCTFANIWFIPQNNSQICYPCIERCHFCLVCGVCEPKHATIGEKLVRFFFESGMTVGGYLYGKYRQYKK